MTYNEKRRLAVRRELCIILEELRPILESAAPGKDVEHCGRIMSAVERLDKIQDDDAAVDKKIREADRLTNRRPYPKPVEDMTIDELARHFGGA